MAPERPARPPGQPVAATAALPATTAQTQVARSVSSEQVSPSSASVPAKPSPHCVGTTSASTMPAIDGTCQPSQSTATPPRKYGIWPGCGSGSGQAFRKTA